jgi:hypothetical protein
MTAVKITCNYCGKLSGFNSIACVSTVISPISVAERSKGKNTHTACDLIRGNTAVDLFPRIESQSAAGRAAPLRCMCVFTLRRGSAADPLQELRIRRGC